LTSLLVTGVEVAGPVPVRISGGSPSRQGQCGVMTPPKDAILGLLLILGFIQVTCELCFARNAGEEVVSAFYSTHLTNPSGEFYFISTSVHSLLVGDSKRAVRKTASALSHRVDLDEGPEFGIRCKLWSSAL
jgi:hypothetical protein